MYTYIANTSIAKIASNEPVTRAKNKPQVVNNPIIGASKNVAIILIIFLGSNVQVKGRATLFRESRLNALLCVFIRCVAVILIARRILRP